jgi:hypothetical protein
MARRNKNARNNQSREFSVDIDGIKLIEMYSQIANLNDGRRSIRQPSRDEIDSALSAVSDLFMGAEVDQHMEPNYVTTDLVETALAVWAFGSFVTAFCSELGKRFGGGMADWGSKVCLRKKRSVTDKVDLLVQEDDSLTVLEISEDLPDDARWALLDLDIKAPAVRGHRLRWNAYTETWEPTVSEPPPRRFWSLIRVGLWKRQRRRH